MKFHQTERGQAIVASIPAVQTAFNYVPDAALENIDYDEPSVTVPDESFTIDDLIARHRAGILTDLKTPIFMDGDDDEDIHLDDVDMEKMGRSDIIDQQDFLARTGETQKNRPVELLPGEKIVVRDNKLKKVKVKPKPETKKPTKEA